ncbi:SPI-2 type III secretion system effector deubiquitinase SseL [Salmonella enterica]|uniref:Deubiquitinase SseL n=1 Tax=Salmonella enterica TaxID=28901 RepID=A0A701YUZ2_SALER|nr:SPI-2 type III secretion system effector deubiquitinase SseL [Salmonella enterica]HAC6564752.1 type III secretion system effector deubiquitinase SseL [Salmonella enterica subsp. indica]HBC0161166.1 SPI-2 type III secretion system effector deubiquitinase SseL [Salmonella enterica subsp. indica]HCM1935385.1 SPI-2 type III secretion system effector deubiquitinase SseL [Salmonella enterica subsp. indica serovar 6,7:z41:1,7]
MNVCVNSLYRLSTPQFESLYSEGTSDEVLALLISEAENGNQNCIDLLCNLALRNDGQGHTVEKVLFDLFSGKKSGIPDIDKQISQSCLVLHQIAHTDITKNNTEWKKLHASSRLLYMAGSATSDFSKKIEIAHKIVGDQLAQTDEEQVGVENIWCSARMLTSDELAAATSGLAQESPFLSVNYPIGLIHPITKENILSAQLLEKVSQSGLSDNEVFLINTGSHWILCLFYKIAEKIKCLIFNSHQDLDENIKQEITEAAKVAGLAESEEVNFIEIYLQNNVPNGCGLFCYNTIQLLLNVGQNDPAIILREFAENFLTLSGEEQTRFNIQTRRQVHEHSLSSL